MGVCLLRKSGTRNGDFLFGGRLMVEMRKGMRKGFEDR